MKTLFQRYNKVVRPVNHFSDAVVVTLGLQLIQLISVVRLKVSQCISKSGNSLENIGNLQPAFRSGDLLAFHD